jgi:hypothetical protein
VSPHPHLTQTNTPKTSAAISSVVNKFESKEANLAYTLLLLCTMCLEIEIHITLLNWTAQICSNLHLYARRTCTTDTSSLASGRRFHSYLEQVVGHVDAEIEEQDPEDAIGAPAPRLHVLGDLQLFNQACSQKQRPS